MWTSECINRNEDISVKKEIRNGNGDINDENLLNIQKKKIIMIIFCHLILFLTSY